MSGPTSPSTSVVSGKPTGLFGSRLSESSDTPTLLSPVSTSAESRQQLRAALEAISDYIGCSMDSIVSECGLLRKLNERSTEHYSQLVNLADDISHRLKETNDRYIALEPSLRKIDQFDARIKSLEEAATAIDQYIGQLEKQFHNLEKI
ncbi:unnamed protein product [Dicrocoelium dendriticum]|nr:unnamed protein product [Dicrocoelium dendriticum]